MHLYLGLSLENELSTKNSSMLRMLENMRTKGEQASSIKVAGEPTGCATRCNSSVIWLESILRGSPVFIRQRYFWSLARKSESIA
jgi:hypothetical protein